jgi:hypothetical protein
MGVPTVASAQLLATPLPRPGRTRQDMGSAFETGYTNVVFAVFNPPTNAKEEVRWIRSPKCWLWGQVRPA